jgi:hypothetical protein
MTQKQIVGHHEAGHSVVAFHFGRSIRAVTIDSEGTGLTRCSELAPEARNTLPDTVWRELAHQEVYICLAGPIAEQHFAGTSDPASWRIDLQRVDRWRQALEARSNIVVPVAITRRLLTEKRSWNAVREIAAHLIQTGSMSGRDICEICRSVGVRRNLIYLPRAVNVLPQLWKTGGFRISVLRRLRLGCHAGQC